jgi:hypothetical protein
MCLAVSKLEQRRVSRGFCDKPTRVRAHCARSQVKKNILKISCMYASYSPILRTNTAYSGYSAALVSIDQRLQDSKYLHGSYVTISDIFLLPTVERFDAIYSCLFRCNGEPQLLIIRDSHDMCINAFYTVC